MNSIKIGMNALGIAILAFNFTMHAMQGQDEVQRKIKSPEYQIVKMDRLGNKIIFFTGMLNYLLLLRNEYSSVSGTLGLFA